MDSTSQRFLESSKGSNSIALLPFGTVAAWLWTGGTVGRVASGPLASGKSLWQVIPPIVTPNLALLNQARQCGGESGESRRTIARRSSPSNHASQESPSEAE